MDAVVGLKQAEREINNTRDGSIENNYYKTFIFVFCFFFWSLFLCFINFILSLSVSLPPPSKEKQAAATEAPWEFQRLYLLLGGLLMVLGVSYHFYVTNKSPIISLEELLAEEEEEREDPVPKRPKEKDIFYERPPPSDNVVIPGTEETSSAVKRKPTSTWSLEEKSLLAKAMAKYPGGVPGRWEKITEMINTISNRTVKEVIARCRELDNAQQRLGKEEAFRRYLDLQAAKVSAKEESKTRQLSSDADVPQAKGPQAKGPQVTDQDVEWNAEQQTAFEIALKTIPKSDDRWDKIAAAVPGKTKKDCVNRFKEIRAKIMIQKVK